MQPLDQRLVHPRPDLPGQGPGQQRRLNAVDLHYAVARIQRVWRAHYRRTTRIFINLHNLLDIRQNAYIEQSVINRRATSAHDLFHQHPDRTITIEPPFRVTERHRLQRRINRIDTIINHRLYLWRRWPAITTRFLGAPRVLIA